jgi:Holliday junction resolvasome RuvABC DNA-binding subunit
VPEKASAEMSQWHQEALDVLLQLQYKKQEAKKMIERALERSPEINTAEELLNEIYKQRINI